MCSSDLINNLMAKAKIKPIMNLSLTSDHRVIDGTVAAKFLKDLKELLENPLSMLV